MKILVITREIPPVGGGAGHVAIHLAEEVAAQGHQVHFVTMHFGELPLQERRGNITIHRIRCGRRRQDSSYLLEMLRFVLAARPYGRRIAREESCEIVHAHAIIPDGVIAMAPASEQRIPLVITAHGSDVPGYDPERFQLAHKLLRPAWCRVLDRAAVVITPSRHLAGLIRIFRPDQAVTIIPNGIRTDTFRERDKSNAFLIVSRLVRRKNYHLFLQALGEISESQVVHIVGEGPMLAELKSLAAALRQHDIRFHGWLKNGSEAWRRLYETSRFFVFPSQSENFPINLLEAQLARTVVLASDIPGNREVLGDDAVYFESLDVAGIARTLRSVLTPPSELWEDMTAHAKERVEMQFSWEHIAGQYLRIYESALNSSPVQNAAAGMPYD